MKYKLIAKGKNWWHFRRDIDSTANSWTVTVAIDGTVMLSGDFSVLVFRRHGDINPDYFPCETDNIGYFAEKCLITNREHKIKEFSLELAKKEALQVIRESGVERCTEEEAIEGVSEFVGEGTPEWDFWEFHTMLQKYIDIEGSYGMQYTDQFKFQFELLKYWTKNRDIEPIVKNFFKKVGD